MKFNYFQTITTNAELDIEDIGNCAIKTFTDDGIERCLIIRTDLGQTRVLTLGPKLVDSNEPENKYSIIYDKFSFNAVKIKNIINSFINIDGITQAFSCTREDAFLDYIDIVAYMSKEQLY